VSFVGYMVDNNVGMQEKEIIEVGKTLLGRDWTMKYLK